MYQTITPVHKRSGKRIRVEVLLPHKLPRGESWSVSTKTRRGRRVMLTDKDCGGNRCRCDAYIEAL